MAASGATAACFGARVQAALISTSQPAHPPSVFVRVADDLYRTESGRETGELLRITHDETGAVTKMNWATYLVTREPYAFGEWLHEPAVTDR